MKTLRHIKSGIAMIWCLFCVVGAAEAVNTPLSVGNTYISSFRFGNLNNDNTGSSNTSITGYSNHTSMVANVVACKSYKVSLLFATSGSTITATSIYNNVKIWIDFNNDDFFDNTERLEYRQNLAFSQPGMSNLGSFDNNMTDYVFIPAGVYGTHKLRVRYIDTYTNFNANSDYTFNGETEDYTINISAPSCTMPGPTAVCSLGYYEADVLLSTDTLNAGLTFGAMIDFHTTYNCGYIQWYYSEGNSFPKVFHEIPNTNSLSITFSIPTTGTFSLWATGLIGNNGKFFVARGDYVVLVDSGYPNNHLNNTNIGYPKMYISYAMQISSSVQVNNGTNLNLANTSSRSGDMNEQAADSKFSIDALSTEKKEFSVYPNPFRSHFMIKSAGEEIPKEIQIYDVKGSLVLRKEWDTASAFISTGEYMDASSLAPGYYTAIFVAGNSRIAQKLVKTAD